MKVDYKIDMFVKISKDFLYEHLSFKFQKLFDLTIIGPQLANNCQRIGKEGDKVW